MKTFLLDLISTFQRYSKRLNDLALLMNKHWVSLSNIEEEKNTFIFRDNNQLIISERGLAKRGSWEYFGENSMLLKQKKEITC